MTYTVKVNGVKREGGLTAEERFKAISLLAEAYGYRAVRVNEDNKEEKAK